VLLEIWILLLATCVAGGALLTYSPRCEKAHISSGDSQSPIGSGELEQRATPMMTGKSLPGRPGNLTVEQEEKLRESWIATLQVFGVLDSTHLKESDSSGNSEPIGGPRQKPGAASPEKPKKKRISLFGRKHKDTDTESTASTDSTIPVGVFTEVDDKYGQTKQFHDTLARQTPESLRAAFWSMVKHDHPDALLLRFLRARKWDVEKALVMMVSTMNWRATEMHVDEDIMRLGEEGSLITSQSSNPVIKKSGEDFLAQTRMGKSFLHGIDKLGRPMCFVRVRLHKQGEQNEESLERYTVFVIESARMLLAPPVDTAVSRVLSLSGVIVDMLIVCCL
jgi:CRAL/TRIO, N-terminal domain/CRAL/TRIO domain